MAMLSVAPRGSRSRVWLRHKLWSDSGEDQASASLRQALLEIRRTLGPVADYVIQADKNTVSLNLDAVEIDALALIDPSRQKGDEPFDVMPSESFLEGLDVPDPEFDDWLSVERGIWQRRLDDVGFEHQLDPKSEMQTAAVPMAGQRVPQSQTGAVRADWQVTLLPPQVYGSDTELLSQVQTDLQLMLLKSLTELGDLKIIDVGLLRPSADRYPWMMDTPTHAGLALQLRLFSDGSVTRAALMFQNPTDGSIIWASETNAPTSVARKRSGGFAHELISGASDEVVQYFLQLDGSAASSEDARLSAAVSTMFRLSREDLDKSERILLWRTKLGDSAQAHAWLAFLATFRVGQRFEFEDAAMIEQAQTHARRALELDRNNALVLTLVAHVHSYLFGEYDFAAGLFEQALRTNPAETLAWDLYAMLHAYAGQPKKALSMARWACHLGARSAYRYYFETTRAITANFAGEHRTAIEAGIAALAVRPDFNSLLRVLVSSHAHLGEIDKARTYLQRLLAVEPNFSIQSLREAGYPGLETEGGRHFLKGLLIAGVPQS